jgi:hypothetical protein
MEYVKHAELDINALIRPVEKLLAMHLKNTKMNKSR